MRGCILRVNIEGLGWWLTKSFLDTYWTSCHTQCPFWMSIEHFHTPKSEVSSSKLTKIYPMHYFVHTARVPCLSKICPVDTANHLVDPERGVEISLKKEGVTERRSWFWDRRLRCLCKLVLVVEENFMQSLSAFIVF